MASAACVASRRRRSSIQRNKSKRSPGNRAPFLLPSSQPVVTLLSCSLPRDLLAASIGFRDNPIPRSRNRLMPQSPIWQTEFGDGALVACAIHDGHAVRPDVADCLRLDSAQRRYEEDPYTGDWTSIASTRII